LSTQTGFTRKPGRRSCPSRQTLQQPSPSPSIFTRIPAEGNTAHRFFAAWSTNQREISERRTPGSYSRSLTYYYGWLSVPPHLYFAACL